MLTTSSDSLFTSQTYSGPPFAPAATLDTPATTLDAAAIWASLRAGRQRIVASFCTAAECHLELEAVAEPLPASERLSSFLDLYLRGESQKFISLENGVAPSTTAMVVRRSLECLGLRCTASTLPTAVLIIVHAAWGNLPALTGSSQPVAEQPLRRRISVRRPNPRDLRILSPAEAQIVDMLVEGKERREMAELRRSSYRTIANQLGQVHKKLRLTGRIPLLLRMLDANTHIEPQRAMLAS